VRISNELSKRASGRRPREFLVAQPSCKWHATTAESAELSGESRDSDVSPLLISSSRRRPVETSWAFSAPREFLIVAGARRADSTGLILGNSRAARIARIYNGYGPAGLPFPRYRAAQSVVPSPPPSLPPSPPPPLATRASPRAGKFAPLIERPE